MNGAHLHLIVNHLPVVLAPTALIVLGLGLWRRNEEFVKVGLGLFVAAALLAIPAYLTGEPAEGIVARYSGVTKEAIERHEDAATGALVVIILAGLAALTHLSLEWRRRETPRWLAPLALVLGLVASVWLGVAANFGGHVRHQELQDTARSR
jgi:uncharacterized membrane protein